MSLKVRKLLKLVYSVVIVFIAINMFILQPSYGSGVSGYNTVLQPVNPAVATISKILIASAQVIVSGYFIIRFTMLGIAYFSSTAQGKADGKNKLKWTLVEAIIAYVFMFLFTKALGI